MVVKLSFGRDALARRTAGAALLLSAAVLLGGTLRADENTTRLPLLVIVYDHAGLPPATLNQAADTATRLYRRIGVEITWLPFESPDLARLTSDGEDQKMLRRALFVRLLSPSMVDARNAPAGVVGLALSGSQFISVLTPRVMALADLGQVDRGVLLGHVIAHEIGHLLLPPAGHSIGGLMSASFDASQASLGQLHFDAWQGQMIRERLSRFGEAATESARR